MPIKKSREMKDMLKKLLRLNYDLAFLLYQNWKACKVGEGEDQSTLDIDAYNGPGTFWVEQTGYQ